MQIVLELQERGLALGGTWRWPAKAREKEERQDQAKSCCKAVQAQCSQEDQGQSHTCCELQATSRNPQRYQESPDSCNDFFLLFLNCTHSGISRDAVACATARKACWTVVTACLYPELVQVSVGSIICFIGVLVSWQLKFFILLRSPPLISCNQGSP